MTSPTRLSPAALIWWILWFGITIGLVAIHATIPVAEAEPTAGPLKHLPMVPLLASSGLRWMVLPRITESLRAFPLFVIGLALAEGGSILGLFLVPELRQTYLVLGVIGLAQYLPFFTSRYRSA
ncbi:hypothetical protein MASR2M8_01840 [Opitutaceae bacterium]